MTVSSDANSLDLNFTDAIVWFSVYTSVSCINLSFVSSFMLMYFVPASSN